MFKTFFEWIISFWILFLFFSCFYAVIRYINPYAIIYSGIAIGVFFLTFFIKILFFGGRDYDPIYDLFGKKG